jgi:hypothetical protein
VVIVKPFRGAGKACSPDQLIHISVGKA